MTKASEKMTMVLQRPKASTKTKTTAKPKAKPKNKAKKEDANKPRKPPTAFFYFLKDFRKEFQEQNPHVKSMRDIGKTCGEKWKTMTYEEKVQYYDIATEKRAEFEEAMQEYIKRKRREMDTKRLAYKMLLHADSVQGKR